MVFGTSHKYAPPLRIDMTTALPRRFTRGKMLGYYSCKYFFYSLVRSYQHGYARRRPQGQDSLAVDPVANRRSGASQLRHLLVPITNAGAFMRVDITGVKSGGT